LWFVPLFATFFFLFCIPDYICLKLKLYDYLAPALEADLDEQESDLIYNDESGGLNTSDSALNMTHYIWPQEK